MIKYLVEHGADINKENNLKQTPMWYACEMGNENIVKYLFEHGADIYKEDENGKVPLIKALFCGNNNLFDYLLGNENIINFIKENYLEIIINININDYIKGNCPEIIINKRKYRICEKLYNKLKSLSHNIQF